MVFALGHQMDDESEIDLALDDGWLGWSLDPLPVYPTWPGLTPSWGHDGTPIPKKNFPDRIVVNNNRRPNPDRIFDWFSASGQIVISEKIMHVVEGFDPGVHQFFRVDLFYTDATPFPIEENFFVFNIIGCYDFIRFGSQFNNDWLGPKTGRVAVSSMVPAQHCWRHVEHFGGQEPYFSNDFVKAIRLFNPRKIYFDEIPEVDIRQPPPLI